MSVSWEHSWLPTDFWMKNIFSGDTFRQIWPAPGMHCTLGVDTWGMKYFNIFTSPYIFSLFFVLFFLFLFWFSNSNLEATGEHVCITWGGSTYQSHCNMYCSTVCISHLHWMRRVNDQLSRFVCVSKTSVLASFFPMK